VLLTTAGVNALLATAQELGFDVTKADWMKYQARQTLELSDEELEVVSGGLILVGGACGNYFSLDPNQTYGHDCISTGGSVRREGDPGPYY